MAESYLDRRVSTAVKGVALICMFVHHIFTFPEYLIDPSAYPWIREFGNLFCTPFKICVPVFAFLTGYFYAFSREKTFRYSLRKISDLYLSYWVVYGILLCFALVTGGCEFSLYVTAWEMTALRTDIMMFCWYVFFYACTMLMLPVMTRSRENSPVWDVLILLVIPAAVTSALSRMEPKGIWYTLIINTRDWFPSVACGYLFAKYDLFRRFFDRGIACMKAEKLRVLLWIFLVLAAFMGRYAWQYLYLGQLEIRQGLYPIMYPADIFYAPMFVYGLSGLLRCRMNGYLFRLLEGIGRHSMLMWFFHCMFYGVSRDILQPILYRPGNPVLVILWALILCGIPSLLLEKPVRRLLQLKNRFL